jgi:hypothetical protein
MEPDFPLSSIVFGEKEIDFILCERCRFELWKLDSVSFGSHRSPKTVDFTSCASDRFGSVAASHHFSSPAAAFGH